MKDNRVCNLLGIKYPIIQGAMAWIADGNLAGHVFKRGGTWNYSWRRNASGYFKS